MNVQWFFIDFVFVVVSQVRLCYGNVDFATDLLVSPLNYLKVGLMIFLAIKTLLGITFLLHHMLQIRKVFTHNSQT